MRPWDLSLDRELTGLAERVCDGGLGDGERRADWRRLLALLAPHVEARAARNRVMRRCRLASEDEVRAVLVGVFERLAANGHDNLKRFLLRQPAPDPVNTDPRLDELRLCAHLGSEDEAPAGEAAAGEDDLTRTPLRAWIMGLTDFVAHDHVRCRLGWSSTARVAFPLSDAAAVGAAQLEALRSARGVGAASLLADRSLLEVEFQPGALRLDALAALVGRLGIATDGAPRSGPTRRDVNSGADRLDAISEPAARSPITDMLTVARVAQEVRAHAKSFPPPMQRALELWLHDGSFAEIARELGDRDEAGARALVRAARARLRERFRGEWPELFGA